MGKRRKKLDTFYQTGGPIKRVGLEGIQQMGPASLDVPTNFDLFNRIQPTNIPQEPGFFGKLFGGIGNIAREGDFKDKFDKSIGDIAGLINFGKNKEEIANLPITQPFTQVSPVQEDVTPRDAAAINEIRRQSRAASLGTQSGSGQREAAIRGGIHAGAISEINKVKTAENLRQDSVRARNAGRASQANIINAGIVNEQFGNVQQNLFTQSQARVQNRQTLVDSLLGNKFQRDNQDLERERMVMIAMRDNDRGTLRRIYAEMAGDPKVSPELIKMIKAQLDT